MSNPGTPQNPYGQPAQGVPASGAPQGVPVAGVPAGSAPTGYPEGSRSAPARVDRSVVRQIVFGGSVVLGIAVVTNLLTTVGNSVFGLVGEQFFGLVWSIFIALVFIVGAGLGAIYVAPLAKATSTPDLIKRLAIAAVVGAVALLVLNFIWSVINGGQYLIQMIISSGILGSVSTGITYGAFFALGVLVARALPASRSLADPAQGAGYPASGNLASGGPAWSGAASAGPAQGYPASGGPAQIFGPPVQPGTYPASQPGYVQPQGPVPTQQGYVQPRGTVQPEGHSAPPQQQPPVPPQP